MFFSGLQEDVIFLYTKYRRLKRVEAERSARQASPFSHMEGRRRSVD